MIARFIDGPLRGQDREVPDDTDYLQVYDSYAWQRATYVKHGFQQAGEVQLFRTATLESVNVRQGWNKQSINDLPLTDADQEMLRGMRIKV